MGADLDRELRHRTRFHQRGAHRVAHEIMHHALLAEADFGLRRVHIDVHFAAGQIEKQQHHRENRGRQDVAVSLDDGVLDQAVADQASIDEDVNRVAVQLLDFGFGDKAVHPEFAEAGTSSSASSLVTGFSRAGRPRHSSSLAAPGRRLRQADAFQRLHRGNGNQLVEDFLAENLVHALAVSRNRRRHQHGVGGGMQFEMLVGMGQRVVRHQRCDMRKLGGFRFEKFLARRNIEEEIADRDRCSGRQAGFFHFENLAAVDLDHRAGGFFGSAGFQPQTGNRSDRGQGFSPKPSVATLSRSSAFLIFEVAWRSKASRASSRTMPQPLSVIWMSFLPPASTWIRMRVAPASSEFSSSSLATDAGRSTTSPAAILLATFSERTWILPMEEPESDAKPVSQMKG